MFQELVVVKRVLREVIVILTVLLPLYFNTFQFF